MNRYFEELNQFPLLRREEELALGRRIKQDGDLEAIETMVNANLRLVVKIAHGYTNCGLPIEDLVAEGNLGLMKAARRYDPDYGVKFSSYAVWWIKQKIMRALGNQSRTIRLPLQVVEQLRDLDKAIRSLAGQLGHDPTDEELADHIGISTKKVAHLKRSSQPVASLDAYDEADLADFPGLAAMLRDESAPDPASAAIESDRREILSQALSRLNPRERAILIARFGLDQREPQTLEEVGEGFGITRERIRQIQVIAMEKLKKWLRKLERVTRSSQAQECLPSRFPQAAPDGLAITA